MVANITGFSNTFLALKTLYAGNEIINKVIAGDLLTGVYGPLMEALGVFGISGPSGVLSVYYYSCKQSLDLLANPSLEHIGHSRGDEGVLNPRCPQELIDFAGRYIGLASCLYAAKLPAPHGI